MFGEYAHPDASAPSIEIDEIEYASAGFGHKPTSAASLPSWADFGLRFRTFALGPRRSTAGRAASLCVETALLSFDPRDQSVQLDHLQRSEIVTD